MPGIDCDFEHVGEAPTRVEGEKFLFCKRCFSTGVQVHVGRAAALKDRRVTRRTDVGRTSAGFSV